MFLHSLTHSQKQCQGAWLVFVVGCTHSKIKKKAISVESEGEREIILQKKFFNI